MSARPTWLLLDAPQTPGRQQVLVSFVAGEHVHIAVTDWFDAHGGCLRAWAVQALRDKAAKDCPPVNSVGAELRDALLQIAQRIEQGEGMLSS